MYCEKLCSLVTNDEFVLLYSNFFPSKIFYKLHIPFCILLIGAKSKRKCITVHFNLRIILNCDKKNYYINFLCIVFSFISM